MGQTTIEWTASPDAGGVLQPGHTINFWWGCTKVSPACLHCYAESRDYRFHGGHKDADGKILHSRHWGPGVERKIRAKAAQKEAFRLDRQAKLEGRRIRVFTNSMSDFFEDDPDPGRGRLLDGARLVAFETIRLTPHLDWLILTKRPENALPILVRAAGSASMPSLSAWLEAWVAENPPHNVWLGATVEDQPRADQRLPMLVKIPAVVHFLSMEPLLGPVWLLQNLPQERMLRWCRWMIGMVDWVIAGGESGLHARPADLDWVRSIRDQCLKEEVPFFFKQWGEWMPLGSADEADNYPKALLSPDHRHVRVGKARAGRLLDGQEWSQFPQPVAPKEAQP